MRRIGPVLAVAAGLVLAACGGGDGGGERLTAAEFTKQGNALCQGAQDRAEEVADEQFPNASEENPPSAEEQEKFLTEVAIPDFEKAIDGVADLRPPEDIEDDVEAAIVATRKALAKVKSDPGLLIDSDDDPFEEANGLLAGVGLDVCGE